jgi:nucleoside-diphosphate-sugar epimerase
MALGERGDSNPARALAKSVAVVGADGHVGAILANALGATRVVYATNHAAARADDLPIAELARACEKADFVVNAGGFSVHPGLTRADYERTHVAATRNVIAAMRPGSALVHISSAAVLGGRGVRLDGRARPDPSSFVAATYAEVKLESEDLAARESLRHGLDLVVVRPSTIYTLGAAGMLATWVRFARRGVLLRLYPRGARHSLCSGRLLAAVVRAAIDRHRRGDAPAAWLVADPFVVTNREIEDMVRARAARRLRTVPMPIGAIGAALRRVPAVPHRALDLHGRGAIYGLLAMDVEYDARATYEGLGLDPAAFTRETTLVPAIDAEFAR